VTVTRVHHLNCGTMRPPGAALIGQRGLGRGTMVCHCIVVETARDGLVLIDSGFSTEDARDPRRVPAHFRRGLVPNLTVEESARHQIEELGYVASEVRHVVLTHLDIDHAGGLVDFPDATVHVHTREHEAATTRGTLREKNRYLPVQWAHGPRWQLHDERGDTWRGLRGIARLPGLDADLGLVALPGHTRGHAGVVVRIGDRWLVHAGDAYFHPRALEPGGAAPFGLRVFERLMRMDRDAWIASVEALRRLRTEPDVDLVCAHEPGELAAAQARAAAVTAARATG
jgi:glyoxylase-like metal-dependent hydrolase (beta-lactamase superfamily II)